MGALFATPIAPGPTDVELARLSSKLWYEVSSLHSQRRGSVSTWRFTFQQEAGELRLEKFRDGESLGGAVALIPNYAYVNSYPSAHEPLPAAFQRVEVHEQDQPLWILQVDQHYTAVLACEPDTKDYYVLAGINAVALSDLHNFLEDCYNAKTLDKQTALELYAEAQHRDTAR